MSNRDPRIVAAADEIAREAWPKANPHIPWDAAGMKLQELARQAVYAGIDGPRVTATIQQPQPECITPQYESPLRHAAQRPLSAQERERGLGTTRQQ